MMLFRKLILLSPLLLAACSVQQKAIQTELHFGLSTLNGGTVSDSAWEQYSETCLGKVFVNGFTILKGTGKWLNTDTRMVETEPTVMVIAANKKSRQLSIQIDSAIAVYKRTFHQQSVLRVDKKITMRLE